MTHLRKMMLEELQRRNYSEGTTRFYLRIVEEFARRFNRPPDRLGPRHIREYQAELFQKRKLSPGTVAHHLPALRFFVDRADAAAPGPGCDPARCVWAGKCASELGGESRLIRMGYGPDELLTRWSARSLVLWKALFQQLGRPLFAPTGILWIVNEEDAYTRASRETLSRAGIAYEWLPRAELEKRWPQIDPGRAAWGLYEKESGALLARRAVAAVVEAAVALGVEYLQEAATAPAGCGRVSQLMTRSGREIGAIRVLLRAAVASDVVVPNEIRRPIPLT